LYPLTNELLWYLKSANLIVKCNVFKLIIFLGHLCLETLKRQEIICFIDYLIFFFTLAIIRCVCKCHILMIAFVDKCCTLLCDQKASMTMLVQFKVLLFEEFGCLSFIPLNFFLFPLWSNWIQKHFLRHNAKTFLDFHVGILKIVWVLMMFL